MSETWTSLLAAFVGAIVGGTASLAGTMVANKRQMATNARMRLYDDLLPKVVDRIDALLDDHVDPATQYEAEEQLPELLEAVRRAGAVAGPFERKSVHNLWALMHIEERPPSPVERRLGRIQEEIRALSDHLAAKLG